MKVALAQRLVHPAFSIRNQMVYLSANGEVIGQFEERDLPSSLAAGKVPPDSFFWREGMPEWRPLRELVLPPRPVRVEPLPEPPGAVPAAKPEPLSARPLREPATPRPISPAITQKKPFVPRSTSFPASKSSPSSQAAEPASELTLKREIEVPDKPVSFWKRLFRRQTGDKALAVTSTAPVNSAQPPPTARLDSLAPKKAERAYQASGVAATPTAAAVPMSPARDVHPPAESTVPFTKRISLPPSTPSTQVPGQLNAPSHFRAATASPPRGTGFLPQVRQVPPVARPAQSLASELSSSGADAAKVKTNAENKDILAGPVGESAKQSTQPAGSSAAVSAPTVTGPRAPSPAQGQALPGLPSRAAPAAEKLSLPLIQHPPTVSPTTKEVAARQAPAALCPTPAEDGSGKKVFSSGPVERKAAQRQIPAKAPAPQSLGKELAAGSSPQPMVAAAEGRGRGGRKGLIFVFLFLFLAALGAAAWWFFPPQPPALRGEVRLAADDGTAFAAAGADVYLVSREELAARWRDQLAEAQSRGAEVEELLKQANSVHREKVLALELASRTSELADEYNMPDAAELRAARDAAQAEEATALAEVEKLRREKQSFASAAALLKTPPDALDQTQTDESGAFTLTLPALTEGLVVLVLAGADGEEPSAAHGWLVPLAGAEERKEPVLLSPANVLDVEQIREIAGVQP